MMMRKRTNRCRNTVWDISVISRNTQGVKLMSTSENDIVASMAVMDQKN